jgi:hypothetical protein
VEEENAAEEDGLSNRQLYPTFIPPLTLVDGQWTGRQTAYFEDGTVAAETYYLHNRRVSRKQYQEACKRDPSLLRYEEAPGAKVSAIPSRKAAQSAAQQPAAGYSYAEQLLAHPRAREVLEWLRDGSAARTLGELPTREASIDLAKGIYDLGASKVTAVRIDRYPDEEENAGTLVISLPKEKAVRERLFDWAAERAEELGYDPEPDAGQGHLLVMLD